MKRDYANSDRNETVFYLTLEKTVLIFAETQIYCICLEKNGCHFWSEENVCCFWKKQDVCHYFLDKAVCSCLPE